MADTTDFKASVAQLRGILNELQTRVAAVEGELLPSHPSILRGLSALQQARMDPHRGLKTTRSLKQWVRTLDMATRALETMSSRWP